MTTAVDPINIVTRLYQSLLGRVPEQAELDGWLQKISQGAAVNEVQWAIRDSAEAVAWAASVEQNRAGEFVDSLYASYLYRRAEPEARTAWVTKIHSGEMTFSDVSNAVFSSEERVNKSGMEKIIGLYQGLLGRGPDAAGLRGWFDSLKAGDQNISQIAQSILSSDEGQLKLNSATDHAVMVKTVFNRLYSRDPDTTELNRIIHRLDSGEKIGDVTVELTTYELIKEPADRSILSAKNLQAYSHVRDEFKALAASSSSQADAPLLKAANGKVIMGTEGPDHLVGTGENEVIVGLGGDDTIEAGLGMDEIRGDGGNDTIYAGGNLDFAISGGDGDDTIFVDGASAIEIDAGAGDDRIYMSRSGKANGSIVSGGAGNDIFDFSVYDWQRNKDTVDGGTGRNGIGFDHIDQDFSFYHGQAKAIDWIYLSTGTLGNFFTYSLYFNPGVWIPEINNFRNASLSFNPFELKILPLTTPFDPEPVHGFVNYNPDAYFNWKPIYDVNGPGKWWSYRNLEGDGFITYWDEHYNLAMTTKLVASAYKGICDGGVIII